MSISGSTAAGFSNSITFLSLLPTVNSIHGRQHEKQSFSMQSAELNFIVRFFQSITELCICNHPLLRMIVYTFNFAR